MQRKHILLIGSFADPGAIEHQYEQGFKLQGWEVSKFEAEQPFAQAIQKSILHKFANRINPNLINGAVNQEVLKTAAQLAPLVILVFKGMALRPETIKELKSFTKLLVNYNPDHPLKIFSRGGTNQNVIDSVPLYDLFFTYAGNIVRKIKQQHHTTAFCIPFGYNLPLHDKYSGGTWQPTRLFAFVGAWDKDREESINKLNRSDINVFGDAEWGTKTSIGSVSRSAYKNKKLYEADLYSCFRTAAGVLNFMREQNLVEASHNMRTFEVPGYGGVLISPYTDEQASYFEPEKEAVYYHSLEELNEKMNYLSANAKTVIQIKNAALKRSLASGYSYYDRAQQMLGIIEEHLN